MKTARKIGLKKILAAALLILLAGYAIALARTIIIWKWVDEKGVSHYTDERYNVPDKYQSKAVKIEIEVNDPIEPSGPPPPPPPPPNQQNSEEMKKKNEWQQKARAAIQEVDRLEKAVQTLDGECNALHQKWVNMPVIANQEALAKCNATLEATKKALAKAREYRDRGIYNEAMQNGVPIQWIDEILKGG